MDHARHLEKLQDSLGYRFHNLGLLRQAMVHRSFAHEHARQAPADNETLEFLGDAVLGLAISHLLFSRFPQCTEGELSRLRSLLVNEKQLAGLAAQMDLGSCLLLGKGEERSGGRHKASLLADSLEAVLAAIYMDAGLDEVIRLVAELFASHLETSANENPLKKLDRDFKTQLQELTQASFKKTPVYRLEAEEGPDHDKRFSVSVRIEDRVLAHGSGRSKKEAQQQAARRALKVLAKEATS